MGRRDRARGLNGESLSYDPDVDVAWSSPDLSKSRELYDSRRAMIIQVLGLRCGRWVMISTITPEFVNRYDPRFSQRNEISAGNATDILIDAGQELPESLRSTAPAVLPIAGPWQNDPDDDDILCDADTVGGLSRLVYEVEELHKAAGAPKGTRDGEYTPDMRRAISRRLAAISKAPGYREFKTYLNAEVGLVFSPDALNEVRSRLANRLHCSFEDVDRLTLVEAVDALNPPTPAPGNEVPIEQSSTAKTLAGHPEPNHDRRDGPSPLRLGNAMSMSISLRELAHRFKRADQSWPGLRHILVEKTEGAESLGIQSATALVPSGEELVWLIPYLSDGPPFAHVFWGLAHDEGNKAFAEFCRLAELTVKLLFTAGRLPAQSPPDWRMLVCVQNHWAGRLMVFVQRLAQENRPASILLVDRQITLEKMGEGTFASVLPLGVFDSVAVALNMVADDVERLAEHDDPSTSDAPRHVPHILRDLLNDADVYRQCLSEFELPPPARSNAAEIERSLAHAMRRICQRIEEIERGWKGREGKLLGLTWERRIRQLKQFVLAQSKRWEWGAFINLRTGGALVEQKYKTHEEMKKLPFIRACLTWRWNTNLNEPRADVNEHPMADKYAEQARSLRLEPLPITSQEAAELFEKLGREWHDDPSLGDTLPSPTTDEVRDVETLVDKLRKWVPTIAPPEPATPSDTIRVTLLNGKFRYVDPGECDTYPVTGQGALPAPGSDGKGVRAVLAYLEDQLTGVRTAPEFFGDGKLIIKSVCRHRPSGLFFAVAAARLDPKARVGRFELKREEVERFFDGCNIEPPALLDPPPIDGALDKGSGDDKSPEEKNRKVREYLLQHKNATSVQVGTKAGYLN